MEFVPMIQICQSVNVNTPKKDIGRSIAHADNETECCMQESIWTIDRVIYKMLYSIFIVRFV